MGSQLTTETVWRALEKELFAVLGMVTAKQEARTVGIVYVCKPSVWDSKLYIGTGKTSWKARHIGANSHVSMTVTQHKRIPFMPWMKIPPATITFHGTARLIPAAEVESDVLAALFRGMVKDAQRVAESVVIEVTPQGQFVTYGIGVSLWAMRSPEQARGRVAVG